MKSKIIIYRKLVKCLFLFCFFLPFAGCESDFLDTTPTNNVNGNNIWTKASLARQAVRGVYNVFLDQYCPPLRFRLT